MSHTDSDSIVAIVAAHTSAIGERVLRLVDLAETLPESDSLRATLLEFALQIGRSLDDIADAIVD
jgi:hypothetical protein